LRSFSSSSSTGVVFEDEDDDDEDEDEDEDKEGVGGIVNFFKRRCSGGECGKTIFSGRSGCGLASPPPIYSVNGR
jgi:hypothetical protein